jgi:general secretion pathway protein I
MKPRTGASNSPNRAQGFTLLEVLASVVIVGVALSVLVLERNRSVGRVGHTDRLRLATMLAQEKLNEILIGEEASGSGVFEDYSGFTWESVEGSETFGDSDRSVNLTVVEVTVSYDDGRRTVSVSAARRNE